MMLSTEHRVDSNSSDLDAHGLVHINASEYFPKKPCTTDDADIVFPFPLISGEYVEFLGRTAEDGIIALSNYRIFIQYPQSYVNLPVRMIEQADIQNYTNSIVLTCKNGTTVRCSFPNTERTLEWQRRIVGAISVPKKLEDLFAFTFYAWKSEERSGPKKTMEHKCFNSLSAAGYVFDIQREAKRMKFNLDTTWRISEINVKYEISPTYPKSHIVPRDISDTDLARIAEFRSSRRFPSIVWRHKKNGSVISRSSQPELGILGWRSQQDENLLQAITTACANDRPLPHHLTNGHIPNGDCTPTAVPKLLILDARSYAAAVANRAKGGGSEYAEYYPNCEIQYMSMANIHAVRKSFFQLRQLCTSPAERVDFMSALDKTLYLHHISAIMKTTVEVTGAVDEQCRPVLVHCSDGWDRTTQIVALAMLILDAHYRTIRGFQTLIEWQWLEFGHKFADRCGHGANSDDTERCPIFLQWLDCVFQLVQQFPVEFEFNEAYLIHVAHHTYSCLFGTFLCNTSKERDNNSVNDRTYSLWSYLEREADESFSNLLYAKRDIVLRPDCTVRNLKFWSNLYITELNPLSANVHPPEVIYVGNDPKIGNPSLPRTRSVENLSNKPIPVPVVENHMHRASSANNIRLNGIPAENVDVIPSENGVLEPVVSPEDLGNPTKKDSIPEDPIGAAADLQDMLYLNSPNAKVMYHKSVSLPNGVNGRYENGEPVSNSSPVVSNGLELSRNNSDGSMERSTDTITGDDNMPTLLLERYPSTQDVRTGDDEDSVDEDQKVLDDSSDKRHESDDEISKTPASVHDLSSWNQSLGREAMENRKTVNNSLLESAIFSDANALPGNTTNAKNFDSRTFLTTSVTPTPLKMVEIIHHTSPVSSPTRPRRSSRHLPSASSTESVHSDLNDSYHEHNLAVVRRQLGQDGLAILHDAAQIRLRQIRHTYQLEVDTLRRELMSIKSSMRLRNGYGGAPAVNRRESCSEEALNGMDIPNGGYGMDCMDYGTSYGSDVSWDNIDDKEAQTQAWVPDHSVTNCTNCGTRFWLGKRKHHCRKCGLVFCGTCSDYQAPLPQDHLYSPVRVCRSCFIELHKQNSNPLRAIVRRHPVNSQTPTHA